MNLNYLAPIIPAGPGLHFRPISFWSVLPRDSPAWSRHRKRLGHGEFEAEISVHAGSEVGSWYSLVLSWLQLHLTLGLINTSSLTKGLTLFSFQRPLWPPHTPHDSFSGGGVLFCHVILAAFQEEPCWNRWVPANQWCLALRCSETCHRHGESGTVWSCHILRQLVKINGACRPQHF